MGHLWGRDGVHLLGITIVVVLASLMVLPGAEAPVIDDWTYAWSVRELITGGELRFLDWSAHYPIAQILWGALFARVLGFSFVTLRVSTLVLAWLGLLAFFLTLRMGGVSRSLSSLTTLVLFFNPVFFFLTYSFMTDVPFVSVMNLAMLGFALAEQGGRLSSFALGGASTVTAFLIRQLGALTALVPPAYRVVVRYRDGRRLFPGDLLLAAVPLLVILCASALIPATVGTTSVYSWRMEPIHRLLSASWWLSSEAWMIYLAGASHILIHASFLTAPLTLCLLPRRSPRALLLGAALVVVIALGPAWYAAGVHPPLVLDGLLSPSELGLSRFLMKGHATDVSPLPEWAAWVLSAVALTAATALVATVLDKRETRGRHHVDVLMFANVVFQVVGAAVLWLYHDRYYLPLLPGLLYLTVVSLRERTAWRLVAATSALLMAVVSVSGTIDHFRFASTAIAAREWLLRSGVAPRDIDAGYALNGWWLYGHPENMPPGLEPDIVVKGDILRLPYVVATSPLPSHEVLSTFSFRPHWAISDRIYVLEDSRVTGTGMSP